jgi:hypothetical protein
MTRRKILLSAGGAVAVVAAVGLVAAQFARHPPEIARATRRSDTPFAAAGPQRSAFITSAVVSCTKQMSASEPLGRHLSDAEIETYCRCYSNGMADVVTMDEVNQMLQGQGAPVEVVRGKAVRVAQSCGEQLRSK